jgi:hypothetical protein
LASEASYAENTCETTAARNCVVHISSNYALELLPIYDGIARMKVQAHWQTDVLAGFALGGLSGYYAHNRDSPFILGVLPHGFTVGVRKQF